MRSEGCLFGSVGRPKADCTVCSRYLSGSEVAMKKPDEKKDQKKEQGRKKPDVDPAFARPENEDDDGYDPWSDRRPKAEPLFERDPWD